MVIRYNIVNLKFHRTKDNAMESDINLVRKKVTLSMYVLHSLFVLDSLEGVLFEIIGSILQNKLYSFIHTINTDNVGIETTDSSLLVVFSSIRSVHGAENINHKYCTC